MDIEELIPNVNLEDIKIEFKRIIEEGKSADSGKPKEIGWLKTIAAFANTQGGSMYIGVDNASHSIISLDHETVDRVILMIHRQIKQRIDPKISYSITTIPVNTEKQMRYVVKVSVEPNSVLPVTLHEENLLGIYIRNFGNTVLATTEQIRDLVLLSDNIPFDQPFSEIKYDSKDFEKLYSLYKERTGTDLTEKALISIGFMSSDKKISKGGLLFRDSYCEEKTKIVCTLWPGETKGSSVILASEEITGNILQTIEKTFTFIKNHSIDGFKKETYGRSNYFSYPARSITEGIVNAIAHRNYFISGTQIEVNLFKDRMEITSPGSLLGVSALNKEKNISSIIPRRRNEVICSVLEFCRYMESKGSGFDKIEQDYAGKGEKFQPFISSDSSSFTLVLPNLTYEYGVLDENSIPDIQILGITEVKNSERILSFCYKKAHTAREIADYLNIKASTYFRKNILEVLVKNEFLIENSVYKPSSYLSNPAKVSAK